MNIKFSHEYPKLHGQFNAVLLSIIIRDRSDLSDTFVNYDTVYTVAPAIGICSEETVDYYPLPKSRYIVMVFLGNHLIPFTTVRRYTEEKFRYYKSNIGETFDIVVAAPENSGAPEHCHTTQAKSSAIAPAEKICHSCIGSCGALYGIDKFAKWYKCKKCKGSGKLLLT